MSFWELLGVPGELPGSCWELRELQVVFGSFWELLGIPWDLLLGAPGQLRGAFKGRFCTSIVVSLWSKADFVSYCCIKVVKGRFCILLLHQCG